MLTLYPYKDLVEIGRGGMATVYRATAPNGNLVALKVLAIHLASDPTARMRFELEGNLRLIHPNIVKVLDWGFDGDIPFIVMDYIVGESLDHLLGRVGTLTPQDLLPILSETAEALNFAHSRGVIHRDVKPSNILIRTNTHALLGDFGVAKSSGWTAYTATAARVGSVFFMSPEQARGAVDLTPATDIYSLGVMAYFALAGKHPFESDNEIAIARMHMDARPKHVSDVNPAVPRAVGAVVMRALEKDPLKRPRSAIDFVQAFEKAIHHSAQPKGMTLWLKPAFIAAAVLVAIMVGVVSAQRLLPVNSITSANTSELPASFTPAPFFQGVAETAEVTETADATTTANPSVTTTPSKSPTMTPTRTPSLTPSPWMTSSPVPSVTPKPIKSPTRTARPPTRTPRPTTKTPRPTSTPIEATSTAVVATSTLEVTVVTTSTVITPVPTMPSAVPLPTVMTPTNTITPSATMTHTGAITLMPVSLP